MKGVREYRRYLNLLKKKYSKKNGVIPAGVLDDLYLFKLETTVRKNSKREKYNEKSI